MNVYIRRGKIRARPGLTQLNASTFSESVLGGAMAGGAAMMFTLVYDQTRFNIGFLLRVKSFTAAVLGGIGNIKGALLGGIVLGLAENYGSAIFGGQWKDVIAFIVLLVVLMFRPTGILGESLGKARV